MKNLLLILLVFGCLACNIDELDFEDIKPPKLESDVAVPLGSLKYTMRELLDQINDQQLDLTEDSSSLLMMIYRDTAEFADANQIIDIEDVSNVAEIRLPATPSSDQPQVIALIDTVSFSYPSRKGEQMDSIFYKTGSLDLLVSSTFPYDLTYTVHVINTVEELGEQPVIFNEFVNSTDLAEYKTHLYFENDSNRFLFVVDLNVTLPVGASLSSSDLVRFDLVYSDQTFDAIYGKFGRDTLPVGNEVMDIAFFKDMSNSGLEFGDPKLIFHFENEFGVPLGLDFGGLFGAKGDSITGDTLFLKGSITNHLQVISGADGEGSTSATTITINRTNSSLVDFLAAAPEQVGFKITALTNPEDADAGNFVFDASRLKTTIEMNMPMVLSMDDVTREVEFDNGNGLKFDQTDSMYIRVISKNELPFTSTLALEIRSDEDSVLHVIGGQVVLQAPYISSDGIVTEARQAVSDFHVSEEGIAAFNNGKKLVLKLTLKTSGQSSSRDFYVKVLADYEVDLKVMAIGRLNYQLK